MLKSRLCAHIAPKIRVIVKFSEKLFHISPSILRSYYLIAIHLCSASSGVINMVATILVLTLILTILFSKHACHNMNQLVNILAQNFAAGHIYRRGVPSIDWRLK